MLAWKFETFSLRVREKIWNYLFQKNVSFGRQLGSLDNRAETSPEMVSIFHSDSRTIIDIIILFENLWFSPKCLKTFSSMTKKDTQIDYFFAFFCT